MKKVFLYFLLSLSTISAFAQDGPKNLADSLKIGFWKPRNSQFGINFSQASFNNWQGGGKNNWAIGAFFNNKAEYLKNKGIFSSDVQLQLGSINNRDQKMVKSIDRIFLDAKYARKINPKVNWFVGANFLSQFINGYLYTDEGKATEKRYTISSLFAPGYLSEGVGLEYKPLPHLVLQLGGATLRQTFLYNEDVRKDFTTFYKKETAYNVEKGKKIYSEAGFQLVAAFDKDIAKNVNLKWRYQGFLAYLPSRKTAEAKQNAGIDHNINLIATAKVNKYLNVNFTLLGIWDKDQIHKFQISQGFAAGLLFRL